MAQPDRHYYEDAAYWSKRATAEGVATLDWSARLNEHYYSIKRRHAERWLRQVPSGGAVVEIGCGVGRMGILLKSTRPDLRLTGVDFASRMLTESRHKGVYTHLIQADACRLPFPNHTFDLVLAMDVLFHIVTPEKKGHAWRELARVAKRPEGVLAYGDSHELTSLASMEQLTRTVWPLRWLPGRARDRITIWLAKRCDGGRFA